jgi:hypothetical protein
MSIKRFGLTVVDPVIVLSHVPTAREQVNFLGSGFSLLSIQNRETGRDSHAQDALNLLRAHKLIGVV